MRPSYAEYIGVKNSALSLMPALRRRSAMQPMTHLVHPELRFSAFRGYRSETSWFTIDSYGQPTINFQYLGRTYCFVVYGWVSLRIFFGKFFKEPRDSKLYGSYDFKTGNHEGTDDQKLECYFRGCYDIMKFVDAVLDKHEHLTMEYANWYVERRSKDFGDQSYHENVMTTACKLIVQHQLFPGFFFDDFEIMEFPK